MMFRRVFGPELFCPTPYASLHFRCVILQVTFGQVEVGSLLEWVSSWSDVFRLDMCLSQQLDSHTLCVCFSTQNQSHTAKYSLDPFMDSDRSLNEARQLKQSQRRRSTHMCCGQRSLSLGRDPHDLFLGKLWGPAKTVTPRNPAP